MSKTDELLAMAQRDYAEIKAELTRLREELATAQQHAKVLGEACVGLMNNGKPDCKDHELRDALIYIKGFPS